MARLSADDEDGISLLPMFNILACTLGVLVFLLATVATVSLGADKAVQVNAVESSEELQGRTPTWIEWDGTEMTLHPVGETVRFETDLRGIETFQATYAYMFDQLAGTRLGAELAEVGVDDDRYIILLLRPSGFRTLPEVRGYLQFLGIELVEEPIDEDWRNIQVR